MATNPVDAIKFFVAQNNLTQAGLVPYIGNRSKVSEVLSGKRELTLNMIRSLHKNLGIPVEVLINEPPPDLPKEFEGIDFDNFPIAEMKRKGAFRFLKMAGDVKNHAEELVRGLIETTGGPGVLATCKCRRNDHLRINAKLDRYALTGWSLHILSEASHTQVEGKYEKGCLDNEQFKKNLVSLSCLDNGPRLAKELLSKHGIILQVLEHYNKTYLDGAAFILRGGTPVVGLTLRYDRLDNFWFVLLHELGHIAQHLNDSHSYFADDMSLRKEDDCDEEKEADQFAEAALLPADFPLERKEYLSSEDVIRYARNHDVSPAVVAGRIQYRTKNYRKFANFLGRNEARKSFT
jgi:HTH-type transcriptional regulator/antitoxin HigA